WRDVAAHPASAARQRKAPDAAELMDHAVAGNQSAVGDLHPSCQQRAAAYDDLIADATVVRYVRILHHEVVVADDGYVALFRAAMNGRSFAKDIAISDSHSAGRAGVGEVLRLIADNRGGMQHVARAK